ncbi:histidine--tRNA ligase [Candidatus Falkowbacteria bacterium CG_4_10_14_0_2_um_filter_41_15]|uniref:Histidine--tRNA ligase n=2 Tax=Candidatus Falkowiibacteriota TaxID=1752728 RepID=A0A2G9ZM76_9BACT|nr:MAG: histidine--tRNA ligase [Candidatus Falkowbacteria bacterium CG23_combo_of_CG06-09_8_20_14_all_41_10]PJA10047.1 MAG: histidine--tRNA ligase [Candidatus Falkowbacteria bacterium CG_4_10_14_0_2_um_filter_41_15]
MAKKISSEPEANITLLPRLSIRKFLSNQPVKGMVDWLPGEFKIRKYIFDTWRQVCLSYGMEEYLTPVLENAEIYRAKSGEDVGQKELMVFVDQGSRELALRPEMTPSVTRLVSKIYEASPKPIKYFSIANFVRNERPQRGRNREFWQLNCDIFGSVSLSSDIEVLTLALDLMLAFNPPKDSFVLSLNHRGLLDDLLSLLKINHEKKLAVARILDKYPKLKEADFAKCLVDLDLDSKQIKTIIKFMTAISLADLKQRLPELTESQGLKELEEIMTALRKLGYQKLIEFKPSVIRGFDYYDGVIFEVFDKHPENNRALFGGGRYNGLAELFGSRSFPAVGFAPGDETTRLFLESWGLLKKIDLADSNKYYLPLLNFGLEFETIELTKKLRAEGWNIEMGLEVTKIGKALEYANKKGISQVIILGEDELAQKIYKVKDMSSGREKQNKL